MNSNSNTNTTTTNSNNGMDSMSIGVKLSSREVTTISERNGRITEHTISDNIIQEPAWTLNNMLERYAFLDTYPWLSSHTSHTVLAKLRVPQDLLTTTISAAPFSNFIYWNGDVEVNFQVTSTPLTQGMLAAVFVPLSEKRFIDSTIVPNFSNVSLNQCVYLYANTNTAARMLISYNSPQAYLDLTQDAITTRNALGYIYLIVFNPIQLAATASDTSSVSIFTRFLNNKFKVPRISKNFTATPQALMMAGQLAASLLTQHKSAPPSGDKSTLQDIASKLVPAGLTADVLDMALGAFGLDKPTDVNTIAPTPILGTQRMNFVQGIETIDKMTLYPSQTYESTRETFATDLDEMDFNFLKKKYTYLGSFALSTSFSKGDVVASWPISPMPIDLFNAGIYQLPLLSYMSVPFQFWKGSLTYKVQVVSTSFQTGKIYFAFNMNTYTPASTFSIGQLTSQYGQAFEINQGSNEIEFSVPYVANTPYLDVPNSNAPSFEDTIGMLNVVILNPLVAPNNTPTTISLNVFVAGGDDFELSTLTIANNLVPTQPLQLPTVPNTFSSISRGEEVITFHKTFKPFVASPQSAVAPLNSVENNVDIAEETLVAPNTSTQMRIDTTQLAPLSVKNLLKKYQMIANVITPEFTKTAGGTISMIPVSSLFGINSLSTSGISPLTQEPFKGLWSHFQPLYRQFKGPLRFKIMSNQIDDIGSFSIFYAPPTHSVVLTPDADRLDTYRNSMFMNRTNTADRNGRTTFTQIPNLTRLPITYVNSIQKTAEFEIPFSTKFLSLLSWTGPGAENELAVSPLINMGDIVVYHQYTGKSGNKDLEMNLFISLGDESRFGNLFQIPSVKVNCKVTSSGSSVSSTWPDSYGTGSPPSNTLSRL